MFRNYIKIAVRNLLRQKFYSAINILGLAIGLACFILIGLWVKDELSYDTHFKNSKRIYRLANDLVTGGISNPMAAAEPLIADQLRKDYPEVENTTRVSQVASLLSYKGKDFYEEKSYYADSTFFSLFDHEFVRGNPATALHSNEAVVITENMAQKLFGSEDPLGKTILLSNSKTKDTARPRIIAGVIKNYSHKSHLTPEVIISKFKKRDMFEYVYIQLREDYDAERFKTKIWPALFEFWKKDYGPDNQYLDLILQPLESIHLEPHLNFEIEPGGNKTHIYVFSVIGIFILLIAAINYMNLATARSYNRSKEVGMRKVLGSSKKQLIIQFLAESIVLSLLALVFALALVEIILPFFNDFSEKKLSLNLIDPATLLTVFLLALSVGVVAGAYPAFFISSFVPVKALKKTGDHSKNKPTLRKALVIVQFSLSIIMIIATMVVSDQLDFVKNKNLGFNKDQVLLVELSDPLIRKKSDILKEELLKNPDISNVAASLTIPVGGLNRFDYDFERSTGMTPTLISAMSVDYNYIDMMGIKIIDGTGFEKSMADHLDSSIFMLVNEAAVKFFEWKKPVGKKIGKRYKKGNCLGVVKNFHIASLHEAIEPMVLVLGKRNFNWLSIKISGKNIPKTISYVENKFKSMSSGYPFSYSFLDESFNKQYKEEEKRNVLFSCFACICIFISCLGLMGLASFATHQRTKEIGVRKISGASVSEIVYLLSKDFIRLVLIALIIAIPVAYYAMNQWLQNFAYHTTINWLIFVFSGLTAIIIALLTISFHTIKAANQDLVAVLKCE
ncbi:MAG: ABC transporter permease [Bacteroidia bacterium]|nr:ABC transporter permease [Bacteroidia bacterium]